MTRIRLAEWKEDEIIEKMVELYDGGYTIRRVCTLLLHEDGVDVDYAYVRDVLIELDVVDDTVKYPGVNPDVPSIQRTQSYLNG